MFACLTVWHWSNTFWLFCLNVNFIISTSGSLSLFSGFVSVLCQQLQSIVLGRFSDRQQQCVNTQYHLIRSIRQKMYSLSVKTLLQHKGLCRSYTVGASSHWILPEIQLFTWSSENKKNKTNLTWLLPKGVKFSSTQTAVYWFCLWLVFKLGFIIKKRPLLDLI